MGKIVLHCLMCRQDNHQYLSNQGMWNSQEVPQGTKLKLSGNCAWSWILNIDFMSESRIAGMLRAIISCWDFYLGDGAKAGRTIVHNNWN
jgi:hypothetical protein